jgi:hypothetical protein
MRSYRCNSPQAAARIVAVSLLADGHLGSDELAALKRERLSERLGLQAGEFEMLMQALCEDLMSATHMDWGDLCPVKSGVVRQLAAELTDSRLRIEVLSLCRTAIEADNHIAAGESAALVALADAWRLPMDAGYVEQ